MGENNGGDAGSAVSQPPTKKSKAEPTVLEQEFDKAGFSYTGGVRIKLSESLKLKKGTK